MDILGVLDSDGHCIRYIVLSFNDSLELSKINILSFSVPGTSMGAVGILSDQSFESLRGAVCEPTLKGIEEMGFTHMTAIQVDFTLILPIYRIQ